MFLDNHLHNSHLFSSCMSSHHHWRKSTIASLNIVWFCATCSQMLTEMCGWAGYNLFPECPNKKTLSKYQHDDLLTGMAIPQPDSRPTAHQSMSWPEIDIVCADHAMLKTPELGHTIPLFQGSFSGTHCTCIYLDAYVHATWYDSVYAWKLIDHRVKGFTFKILI